MSWHRTDNDLLSEETLRLLTSLPSPLGAAALGYLTAVRSWCSAHRKLTLGPEVTLGLGRLLGLSPRTTLRLVEALVQAGYLDRSEQGHDLREAAVVGPVAARTETPETGKAAPQRRYKERLRGRLPGVSPETGGETGGVSQGDGGASPEASPGVSPPPGPPTPAHARVQAQAPAGGEPPEPPGGAPAAAPPPSDGGKKPKKPAKTRTLPPRAALAAAYAAGVSRVTGAPCSPPTERWALDDLEAMLSAHAPGLVGAEALGWLTRTAQGFASDKLEDRWTVDKGFPPKMARSWLDGGNRPPPDHGPRPPPPGPKVRPGPGPTHNWLLDEPPPEPEGDSVEELTRDLFAMPPDLLTPEAAQ